MNTRRVYLRSCLAIELVRTQVYSNNLTDDSSTLFAEVKILDCRFQFKTRAAGKRLSSLKHAATGQVFWSR